MNNSNIKYIIMIITTLLFGAIFDGSLIVSCIIALLFMLPFAQLEQLDDTHISNLQENELETMIYKVLLYLATYITIVALLNRVIESFLLMIK